MLLHVFASFVCIDARLLPPSRFALPGGFLGLQLFWPRLFVGSSHLHLDQFLHYLNMKPYTSSV